jgi:hypothetical protein
MLDIMIVRIDLLQIQNKKAGAMIFILFQQIFMLRKIDSIKVFSLKDRIIGAKDKAIDSNTPGITKNIKPN